MREVNIHYEKNLHTQYPDKKYWKSYIPRQELLGILHTQIRSTSYLYSRAPVDPCLDLNNPCLPLGDDELRARLIRFINARVMKKNQCISIRTFHNPLITR